LTTCSIHRNDDCDRQLKVVACRRKGLHTTDLVPEPELPACKDRGGECYGKVDQQGRANAEDGGNGVHDVLTLRCEEDDDGVDEADERKW